MKKKFVLVFIATTLLIFIFSILIKSDSWESQTYYSEHNDKIIFNEYFEKNTMIEVRLDTKIKRNTDVFLELHTSKNKIIVWNKDYQQTKENLNYLVEIPGQYSLKLKYTNNIFEEIETEVEVNWKFTKIK